MNLLHDKRNIAPVITNPANGETIWNGSLYFLMSINSLRNIILNNDIWTLTYIIHHNDFIIAKLLLDKFIQYYDPLGDDSLLTASVYGSLEMVQFLFENGCNYHDNVEYVSPDIRIIKYNMDNYVNYMDTYNIFIDSNYSRAIQHMFDMEIWSNVSLTNDRALQIIATKKIDTIIVVFKNFEFDLSPDIHMAIGKREDLQLIQFIASYKALTSEEKRQIVWNSSKQFEIRCILDSYQRTL